MIDRLIMILFFLAMIFATLIATQISGPSSIEVCDHPVYCIEARNQISFTDKRG